MNHNLGRIYDWWVKGFFNATALTEKTFVRNRDQLMAIAVGILVFVGSIYFSPLYMEGDQWTYKKAYRVVEGLDLLSAYSGYNNAISGGEFVHFLVIWLGSTLAIEKNLLMAFVNALVAAYSLMLIRRFGGSLYLAIFLVLTNFYCLVLYFSAERLKIGILFLVLALLNVTSAATFLILSALALFSHYSLIFIYSGIWLMLGVRLVFNNDKQIAIKTIIIVLAGSILMLVFQVGSFHIYVKLATYLSQHEPGNLNSFGPILILIVLSCLSSKRLVDPILLFLPLVVGTFFLGGSRLNMLSYFLSLY
jgi:hypothetical protein